MDKKIALVTGANAGMGKATVEALADRGIHVVMLCRSEKRGKEALREITQKEGRSVELMLCDLSDMESIRHCAGEFKKKFRRLDILVNSAGVITLNRRETKDGLELQFGVNHIGHFLLTLLLLEPLSGAERARIVVVGSGTHHVGRIHFNDYNLTRGYNAARAYGQSKLANLLFTRELARLLKEQKSNITINCAHPGAVATQMGVDRETGFGKSVMSLLKYFFQTPAQGARTAVHLAVEDSVRDISGEYFYRQKVWRTSGRGKDMQAARRLFELSEKICGITFSKAFDL